jgi:hypothetical protein
MATAAAYIVAHTCSGLPLGVKGGSAAAGPKEQVVRQGRARVQEKAKWHADF